MDTSTQTSPFQPGKPADCGQLILQRRFRILTGAIGGESIRFARIADIGCGNGAQTASIATLTDELHALDLMPHNLELAKALIPSGTFHQGRAEALPFADNHFPLVTSFEMIEHVDDDAKAIRELARICTPGGLVAVSVPNKWWVFETHGATVPGPLGKLPWNRMPFIVSWLPRPLHERFANARIYTRRRILRLLQAAGLEVLTSCYVTAPMDVLPVPLLQNLLRATIFRSDKTVIPFLATSHFILCCKPS